MDTRIFIVYDKFDKNLIGYDEECLVGVFTSLGEARFQVEELKLDHFRWLGTTRGEFTKDHLYHEIVIKAFIMNSLKME